ncbi:MAG: UDP-N-acetylglucosamine--N-acetylmuramyl-(pentapeptide) pyrophosphoryl-undecaprenol N-acetylglucosamine transferase [Alphaproteobacteria bacterium]|nr:UDP-N-acetylglucosamine--N-acetylmuramyl-(pentapeptide) pyrophosphoryl-undecaprenol N-acetylglucosamine transferase [Alphaproteobacteria bacterium]
MFPALAVAEVLARRGLTPVLVTDERGDRYAAPFGEVEKHVLPAANVTRGKLSGGVNLARATVAAARLFGRTRPLAVMGFGGYATLPALIAARLRGIPTCVHEQNAVLGRVNRVAAGFIDRIALSFPDTSRLKPAHAARTTVTGNPVRAEVVEAVADYAAPVDGGPFRVLVLGGSQGASVLGEVVPAALAALPEVLRGRLAVTQQCRPEDLEKVRGTYAAAGIEAELAGFFADVALRLAQTHLVIARAGASTISELEVAGRPAVLVPLPGAMDDHQTANAAGLAATGGAWVMPQPAFTAGSLAERMRALMEGPEALVAAAAAARAQARPEAAERLADLVEGLVRDRAGKARRGTAGASARVLLRVQAGEGAA